MPIVLCAALTRPVPHRPVFARRSSWCGSVADVTEQVRGFTDAKQLRIKLDVKGDTFGGIDPAPGVKKSLKVRQIPQPCPQEGWPCTYAPPLVTRRAAVPCRVKSPEGSRVTGHGPVPGVSGSLRLLMHVLECAAPLPSPWDEGWSSLQGPRSLLTPPSCVCGVSGGVPARGGRRAAGGDHGRRGDPRDPRRRYPPRQPPPLTHRTTTIILTRSPPSLFLC